MSFNVSELEAYRKQTKSQLKSGNDREFQQKEIPSDGSIDIRLLKPRPNQGGEWKFFVEVKTYWFNKKPFISNCFQGGRDIIAEAIADARGLGDKSIDALLDSDAYSVNTNYLLPARIITDVNLTSDGSAVKSVVIDEKKDIFSCTIGVFDQINDIICSKAMLVGRNGGVFDPEKGNSITINKTGEKKSTRYKVMPGLQFAMPEEFHKANASADIMAYLRKRAHSDEYLEMAARNFLYGEDLPKEDIWKKDVVEEQEEEDKPVAKAVAAPKASAAPKVTAPPAKTVAPPAKVSAPPKKNLADDLDALADLDDEDEEGDDE